MSMRVAMRTSTVILAMLFITMVSPSVGVARVSLFSGISVTADAMVIGPVNFFEIYFQSGGNLERRFPKVAEEFTITTRIRNEGYDTIYYLPTLCDTSLAAVFDPSYVSVESGRPRCLAYSMPAPLGHGEEAVVRAPESGTAYVAIRAGSTTATLVFTYNPNPNMDPSTSKEARTTIPLTIQDGFQGVPILGISLESIILGFALALAILFLYRKIRGKAGGTRISST
jgi:hypothetical protein